MKSANRKFFSACAAGVLIVVTNAATADDSELEPCINGAVSASGMYASQTEETEAKTAAYAEVLELEPCMNGAVSQSGLYPSQSKEEAMTASLAAIQGIGSGEDQLISAYGGNRVSFER